MTGASTLWTLLSSTRISMALRQRAFTSDSLRGSHFFSCSICLSRSDISLSSQNPLLPQKDPKQQKPIWFWVSLSLWICNLFIFSCNILVLFTSFCRLASVFEVFAMVPFYVAVIALLWIYPYMFIITDLYR